jgi:CRISPR-associated endonuclease/helicase Cas3
MRLLAKSVRENNPKDFEALTLPGHLELGILAAREMEAIAPTICRALNLDIDPEKLIEIVSISIWIHDWGKANEDFQAFVQSKSKKDLLKHNFGIQKIREPRAKKQAIRHELLSVLLAQLEEINVWLKPVFKQGVILGVLAHHQKVKSREYFDIIIRENIEVFIKNDDFTKVLNLGVDYFGLDSKIPELSNQKKLNKKRLEEQSQELLKWFDTLDTKYKDNFQKLKENAAVKAMVMSADLAASALLETEIGKRDYSQWIREALKQVLTAAEIQSVIDSRLDGKPLRDFQKQEAEKPGRVLLVIAGCGVGKTLVPFLRFQRLIKQGLEAKMFFCYPTTATTSQGFKDYGLTEAEKTLLSHSRSWVDYQLKGLSDSYENESDEEDSDDVELFQTKVEALRIWYSKLIFCTAHTVLGLIQNYRKGLYGFPGIVRGAFVFDEIHAYPPELFGALLEFLRIFRGSQIVLMSASMTPAQRKAIEDVLAENNEEPDILEGPQEIENLPRYKLLKIESEKSVWEEAIAELKKGGKVLWITNQVADCQRIYTEAADKFKEAGLSISPIIYHGRFRYRDSIQHHEELIAAFKPDDKPAFAVTTQIAEMSLDISCTLLISANAPMWALVQRLGRLNRWVEETQKGYELKLGRVCKALVYPWQKKNPYKKEDLQTGEKLLESLGGKEVCQKELEEAIATLNLEPPKPSSSTWLQTWLTTQKELMPAAYTIQIVLQDDVDKIFEEAKLSGEKPSLEAQKWVVSVRIKKTAKQWCRNPAFKFYRIAPTNEIYYHPKIGAYEPENEFLKVNYGCKTETYQTDGN